MPTLFHRVVLASALAAVCLSVSIGLYPGGTLLDSSTSGYSVFQNFLSDLGMTVSYSGEGNLGGASFFAVSLVALVLGIGSSLPAFVRVYQGRTARRLACAGLVAGVGACISFTVVALTPENSVIWLHVPATRLGWAGLPIVAVLFGLASLTSRSSVRRITVGWFLMAATVLVNVLMMEFGPSIDTHAGLFAQTLSQKAATLIAVIILLSQAYESERVHSSRPRSTESGEADAQVIHASRS